jgi:hypothetical protein
VRTRLGVKCCDTGLGAGLTQSQALARHGTMQKEPSAADPHKCLSIDSWERTRHAKVIWADETNHCQVLPLQTTSAQGQRFLFCDPSQISFPLSSEDPLCHLSQIQTVPGRTMHFWREYTRDSCGRTCGRHKTIDQSSIDHIQET